MALVLASRFHVQFLAGGLVPNPFDVRFQRVSGLSASVETASLDEGGQNRYSHRFPRRVRHENLVLERGFVVGSPLNFEFNAAMTFFKFLPSDVIVSVLNETGSPISAWMFLGAFPTRWATADLNGTDDQVLIDTLELTYKRMLTLRI